MKRLKYILQENKSKKNTILESTKFSGKTIISVDIQPEYESYIKESFSIDSWLFWLAEQSKSNRIIFLYNGADTLDMISESSYKDWLYNMCIDAGMNEEDIEWISNCTFYDKGYAFFRYCLDQNADEEQIVHLIKFMIKHNINDSREIDSNMWVTFKKEYPNDDEIKDLMEVAEDMINIPDLMDFLKKYNSIVLLGGGINECLKEVELALEVLDKPFTMYHEYIY